MEAVIYFVIYADMVLFLAWVLLHCHLASDEAHNIIINIQKMIARHEYPKTVESDLKKFVLQIKGMPMQFTPCGPFTLNLSFLCTTVGVICTYIVILIQIGD